jgi:hypothetical protein
MFICPNKTIACLRPFFVRQPRRFYFEAADFLWKVLSDAGELPEALTELEGKERSGWYGGRSSSFKF